MALQISKAELTRLADKARRLEVRAKGIQEQAKHAVKTAVRTVEVTGAAFIGGAIQGYTYDPKTGKAGVELMGVPLDLILAGGGHLAAFTLFGNDDLADHAHAFADGFLAVSAASYGRVAGRKLKQKTGGAVKGLLGGDASEEEV